MPIYKNNKHINRTYKSIDELPDTLYFSSPDKIDELKGKVFLSPYIGISSIFLIDFHDIKSIRGYRCNLGFKEWNETPDSKLKQPLKNVHITHNIKEIKTKEIGTSSGYIHYVDIRDIKDKLSLFVTNDPNREVIYNGDKPLKIIKVIPHILQWECSYDRENEMRHGPAKKFDRKDPPIIHSLNTPEKLLKYMDKIKYGYKSKDGKIQDGGYNMFGKDYILQSPQELLESNMGVCWDQTELERYIFSIVIKLPFKTYYIEQQNRMSSTHTFLVYHKGGNSYYFEHSYECLRGIKRFNNDREVIEYIIERMRKDNKDTGIEVFEYGQPTYGIGCLEFMDFCRNKEIMNESSYDRPYSVKDIKKNYPKLSDDLLKDPVHRWRAETGIELVHKEPTIGEQERIWDNWNLMSDSMKRKSDKKSIELFGVDNKTHHNKIMNEGDKMGIFGNRVVQEINDPLKVFDNFLRKPKEIVNKITYDLTAEEYMEKYHRNNIRKAKELQPKVLKIISKKYPDLLKRRVFEKSDLKEYEDIPMEDINMYIGWDHTISYPIVDWDLWKYTSTPRNPDMTDSFWVIYRDIQSEIKKIFTDKDFDIDDNGDWDEGAICLQFKMTISKIEPVNESDTDEKIYRITYKNEGIYEALRKNVSREEWHKILNDKNIKWLPKPKSYPKGSLSYFTQDGYDTFNTKTLPIVLKYLDKKDINIKSYIKSNKFVYKDKYQIIYNNIHLQKCEDDVINENMIFSKDDIYCNFDKWGKGNNLLLVTGISGAGKTTLMNSLVEKYKCEIIHFDEFVMEVRKPGREHSHSLLKEYIKMNPGIKINGWDGEDTIESCRDFYYWLDKELQKDKYKNKLYVLEGFQIYDFFDGTEFKDKPIIIKGTSALVAWKRRTTRMWGDAENNKKKFKTFIDNIGILFSDKYFKGQQKIDKFADTVKENTIWTDEEYNSIVLEATDKPERKFKCPYCDKRFSRQDLVYHIEDEHEDMMPEGYTAARIVFNYINKKETGHCVQCGKETQWNEDTWRYDRFCSQKCTDNYSKMAKDRMMKVYGKKHLLGDEEQQRKMLENRGISGKYKFSDGVYKSYCGTYEQKLLEFFDKVLQCKSKDVQSPGPTIEYEYNGEKHFWITDQYYIPANLVFDVKDGGDNPNTRKMPEYRAKQEAKEKAIREQGQYNYIRLTDNKFTQLLLILAEIKARLMDDNQQPVIHINEYMAGAAANPPVGMDTSDGSYIVPCMMNNSFTDTAYTTDKYMSKVYKVVDGKIVKTSKNELEENYTIESIYRYLKDDKEQRENFLKAYKEQWDVSPDYFYTKLSGKQLLSKEQIMFDECFEETIDAYKESEIRCSIIESSMNHQYKESTNTNIYFPLTNKKDIFEASRVLQPYPTLDIQQDVNGYFAINKETKCRTESCKSLDYIDSYVYSILCNTKI